MRASESRQTRCDLACWREQQTAVQAIVSLHGAGLQSDIDVANVKMSLNPFCEIAVEARGPGCLFICAAYAYRSGQSLCSRGAWYACRAPSALTAARRCRRL